MPAAARPVLAAALLAAERPGDDPASEDTAALLERINAVREAAGVERLQSDPRLARAARAHSTYLASSGAVSHRESDARQPEFSGDTPARRIAREGVVAASSGELVHRGEARAAREGAAADLFVSAVFHRFTLLRPDLETVGAGQLVRGEESILTIDLAGRHPVPTTDDPPLIVWPAHQAAGIPSAVDTDSEDPDPLPDQNKAGYPVSVQVEPGHDLRVRRLEIRPRGGVAPIDTLIINHALDRRVPEWAVFAIARRPLIAGLEYEVNFEGTVDGARRSMRWVFRTAPISLRASREVLRAGERVDFAITGIDPSEAYVVCVSDRTALTGLRFGAPGRFSMEGAAACGAASCGVEVRIAYERGCAVPLAGILLELHP